LLKRLLNKQPEARTLGGKIENIKADNYFSNINWELMK